MRAIDPEVTGMPVLGEFLVERSRTAMRRALWLGGLAVLGCVALDLRRPRWVLLAVAPTALTMLALPWLLRALGIALDPISVMALPVILGVGVDSGVHMVHRFRAEHGDVARTVAGTGRAVVLTSLTTLAAFATLMLAHHRGLASFGSVLAVGVSAALAFSVLVLPVALSRFGQPRSAARTAAAKPPSAMPFQEGTNEP
jgi:predicted RND superfamily exporter protein